MDTLTPWQLGCVNTTPQKALRLPQPLERRMHKPLKMAEILRNTIRNCALKIAPHMFIWVKLRRIAWEPKCLKARMFANKIFNQLAPMRHPGIPEQQDGPAEMFEKMPEKLDDLRRLDVFASIKSRVEGQPSALWSDTDGGDGRNLSPTAGTPQLRRLPFGRPSADQVRNQEEAAFVKKHKMGAKSFGFFLYAAIDSVSIWLWPFRPSPVHASPASGNSNPTRSEFSRYWAGYTAPRIWSRLPDGCDSASRRLCDTPPLMGSAAACPPVAVFDRVTKGPGVPMPVSVLGRLLRAFCSPASSGRQSLTKSGFCLQPAGKSSRRAETLWRVSAGFPTEAMFQVVSCII